MPGFPRFMTPCAGCGVGTFSARSSTPSGFSSAPSTSPRHDDGTSSCRFRAAFFSGPGGDPEGGRIWYRFLASSDGAALPLAVAGNWGRNPYMQSSRGAGMTSCSHPPGGCTGGRHPEPFPSFYTNGSQVGSGCPPRRDHAGEIFLAQKGAYNSSGPGANGRMPEWVCIAAPLCW